MRVDLKPDNADNLLEYVNPGINVVLLYESDQRW